MTEIDINISTYVQNSLRLHCSLSIYLTILMSTLISKETNEVKVINNHGYQSVLVYPIPNCYTKLLREFR